MRISDASGNLVAAVTGVYYYNDNAIYTEGDIVIDQTTNDIYVCIKDMNTSFARNYFSNPEYFRPFWYLYAIRDLNTYISSIAPDQAEKPVLKRVLDSVIQRKFGTGILIADSSLHAGGLDLNTITHTGRYIIYVKEYEHIKNVPTYMLNALSPNTIQTYVSQCLGLDVFSVSNSNNGINYNVVQVIFSNNNNKVSIAVRSGTFNGSIVTWNQWQIVRSSFNIRLINDYLETHRNIVESLYDTSRKQSAFVNLNFVRAGNNLIVQIPSVAHNLFRQISALFIVAKHKDGGFLVSDSMPLVLYHNNAVQNNFKVRYDNEIFDCTFYVSNSNIQIQDFYTKYEPFRVLAVV